MIRDWEILAVRYGTRHTTKKAVYLNYGLYGEPDVPFIMDYFFWVLRSPEETIVIDSGFSPEACAARGREPVISPADALTRLGIDPLSVKTVILTHAHWDHTGNLPLFANARIVMSRTEYDYIADPISTRPQLASVMELKDNQYIIRAMAQGRVTLTGPHDTSLPGIELRELPGHAPGQLAVIVPRPQGPVILSSDVTHYYEELEKDWPFCIATDFVAMYRSLAILRQMAAAPGAVLVPGHDPEVMTRFPLVDPEDPGFAVYIR